MITSCAVATHWWISRNYKALYVNEKRLHCAVIPSQDCQVLEGTRLKVQPSSYEGSSNPTSDMSFANFTTVGLMKVFFFFKKSSVLILAIFTAVENLQKVHI